MNPKETEKKLLELLKSGTGDDLYWFQRGYLSELDSRIIDRVLEIGNGYDIEYLVRYLSKFEEKSNES